MTPLMFPYYGHMDFWTATVLTADKILFILFFISVAYLAFFAFLSMFTESKRHKPARRQNSFVVVFPYSSGCDGIRSSIESLAGQDYPRGLFEIIVVCGSDCRAEPDPGMPVTVIRCAEGVSSKTDAIRRAVESLGERACRMMVVMDPGNTVEPTFLTELNDAYEAGCKAIQVHRKAKSTPTDTALFGAASQEINNSIFRRGHVRMGLSSALAGSGMAFDLEWLKGNIGNAVGDDLEKQLEIMLLEQNVFIEYLNHVVLYEDKAERPADFYRERKTWMAARLENIRFAFRRLPAAIASGNFDYCDKLFQWLMPSRTILLGMLALICVALMCFSWPVSLKWWGLLFLTVLSFSMAMPDYMIDARFVRAVKTMPLLFLLTAFNVFRKRVFKAREK